MPAPRLKVVRADIASLQVDADTFLRRIVFCCFDAAAVAAHLSALGAS